MSDPIYSDAPDRGAWHLGSGDLVLLATLLDRYERAEPASAMQLAAFVTMRETFPNIDMPTRLEPRSAIMGALAADAQRDEDGFAHEVHAAISFGGLGLEALATLLSLLADARLSVDSSTISDLVDRLASMPTGELADDVHSALISLAGRRPLVVISLLERLQALPFPRPTAAFGALQSLATDAPDHLGAAMSIACRTLGTDSVDPASLAYVLRDLCHRAGAYVVLVAIAEQDLGAASPLLAAAFATADSPFRLQQLSFEDEERQCLEVSFEGGVVPLSGRGLGRPVQPWLAAVRRALRTEAARVVAKATAETIAASGERERAGAAERAASAFTALRTRIRISDAGQVPASWRTLVGAIEKFSRKVA